MIYPNIINYTFTSKLYLLNIDGVNNFESKLATGQYGDIFSFLTKNPMEAISSLRLYPIDLHNLLGNGFNQTNQVTLASTSVKLDKLVYEYNPYAYQQLLTRLMIRMVSNYHVERRFNNFLDYAPYTRLKLYLPYLDTISLNVSEVMDKYISVYYVLDLMTGNCTAYVESRVDPNDTNPKLVTQVSGILGMDIPIGQINVQEMALKNLTNTITLASSLASIGVGAVSGNMLATGVGLIGTARSSTIGYIEANQEHHTKGKASGDFSSFYAPQDIYLIRETIDSEAIDYANIKGRPMAKYVALNTLEGKGFTRLGGVHLEGFNYTTSSELEEIESYLLDGVLL